MKRHLAIILTVILLCSCTQKSGESVETTFAEETVTKAEKLENYVFYSIDERVQSYMEQLTQLDSFNELIPQTAQCLICDLDSNGTPEVIVQISATSSVSAVFSVDEEGAFMAEPAGGTIFTDEDTWRSYDGGIPQSFIFSEQDQYFADCWVGGTVSGDGGIIKINLNGRKLSSEYVGEWSYGEKSYTYHGFEDEEQYNDYIHSYFGKFEPQWKLMPYEDFHADDIVTNEKHITALLEEYYTDRDKLADFEELLDDDLSFRIEYMPVYKCMEYYKSGSVDTDIYAYDYTGQLLENEYGSEFTCTYYPNGKIKSKSYKDGDTVTYDEDGNVTNGPAPDELTYDEIGRVKTRTTFTHDVVNGGYCIHIATEYFYNDDTDEVVKKIRTYNENTIETYLYENGLEVRFEWYDSDEKWFPKRIMLKWYTPDGLIAKTEYKDGEGNTARTITYEYDSENRLIKEESVTTEFYWDESDRCNDYICSYTYDEDGKLLFQVNELGTYFGNIRTYEYIYDKDGNLVEMINTNSDDNEMVGYSNGSFVTKYRPVRIIN